MHLHQAYSMCMQHMDRFVEIRTTDGRKYKGFIEKVDNENVYLAVPRRSAWRKSSDRNGDDRQFYGGLGYGGYNPYPPYPAYPPYGYGPGYYAPYPRYPRRYFRRAVIPLIFLTALAARDWD